MSERNACERVRGRLERLLDGGLPAIETARDRGHLEACAACRDERADWSAFLGRVRVAQRPDAQEVRGARGGVRAILAASADAGRAARRRRRAVWTATAAAVLAVALVLDLGGGGLQSVGRARLSSLVRPPSWGTPVSVSDLRGLLGALEILR